VPEDTSLVSENHSSGEDAGASPKWVISGPFLANFGELPFPVSRVNKGKGGEGRGYSTMALQVLPVGGGVRFFLRPRSPLKPAALKASDRDPASVIPR
jgi:hypothetical protein